jgi:hypothetical protein
VIELKDDELVFSFPKVHPGAQVSVRFERTLRIPDDGRNYPLPPGLDDFPLRHVDDFSRTVPRDWLKHGGVMLPMYQSEAMWLYFDESYIGDRDTSYPFALMVAAGKINAVNGEEWRKSLNGPPSRRYRDIRELLRPGLAGKDAVQNYLVVPEQPWLDGFCVERGTIRQFVAMPLGQGYSAEEQVTGEAEFGGLQIAAYPMKRDVFEQMFPKKRREAWNGLLMDRCMSCEPSRDMGLAPGGRMKQEIYEDPYGLNVWDQEHVSRCFVHIANSLAWQEITGQGPPTKPPTSMDYEEAGLPWFEYYDDEAMALNGSKTLGKLKSVVAVGKEKGETPLPENESVDPENVVPLQKRRRPHQVREGTF